MKGPMYVLNEAERKFLDTIFPGYPYVHIEPKTSNISIEEGIAYGGKYVIYGSKKYVKTLAEKLKDRIGGVIETLKYSTIPVEPTPNAPKNKCALIVYCNTKTRSDVMKILEGVGIEYFEWKSTRDSWRRILTNRLYSLQLYRENPEVLKKLCELVGMEQVFEFMDGAAKFASEYAPKFKAIGKLLSKQSGRNLTEPEVIEFIQQQLKQ